MLAAKFHPTKAFVMTTFGCQYHGKAPSAEKKELIDAFSRLVRTAGVPVEEYEQEDASIVIPDIPVSDKTNATGSSTPAKNGTATPPRTGESPRGHAWLTWWNTEDDFNTWWATSSVRNFWQSLPETDAGFWRETTIFHDGRTMFETNKETPNGFGHVGKFCPLGEKTGYWGAYRERLTASTPIDKLSSAWNASGSRSNSYDSGYGDGTASGAAATSVATAEAASCPHLRVGPSGTPETSAASAPSASATTSVPAIVPHKIVIKHFPDNLCCVVEGQDRSNMGKREREYWFENFEDVYNEWIQTAVFHSSLAKDGIVQARMFHDPNSGAMRSAGFGSSDKRLPLALQHNRLLQVIYFQDMSYMEKIGRRYASHLKLRRKFMEAYGPGGDIIDGNIVLWVDLGILKSGGIQAEYIGCYEGSGFMAYRDHQAFT
ncbi:hypothetical protein Sste5346_009847 [Sporothrix stenoceras]|uniref:Aldoxime dehydratase n=1 Tax=Sporothrix stenoceras TaxID=5173 RepID=A0ABR3YI13_9PEZI